MFAQRIFQGVWEVRYKGKVRVVVAKDWLEAFEKAGVLV